MRSLQKHTRADNVDEAASDAGDGSDGDAGSDGSGGGGGDAPEGLGIAGFWNGDDAGGGAQGEGEVSAVGRGVSPVTSSVIPPISKNWDQR